jgi:hypothetical protein
MVLVGCLILTQPLFFHRVAVDTFKSCGFLYFMENANAALTAQQVGSCQKAHQKSQKSNQPNAGDSNRL